MLFYCWWFGVLSAPKETLGMYTQAAFVTDSKSAQATFENALIQCRVSIHSVPHCLLNLYTNAGCVCCGVEVFGKSR